MFYTTKDVTYNKLLALVLINKPNASNLIGSSGNARRIYTCNMCGSEVDSESGRWPMTKHASKACNEHLASHVATVDADLAELIISGEFEKAYKKAQKSTRAAYKTQVFELAGLMNYFNEEKKMEFLAETQVHLIKKQIQKENSLMGGG